LCVLRHNTLTSEYRDIIRHHLKQQAPTGGAGAARQVNR
jgi:hypothetical protein